MGGGSSVCEERHSLGTTVLADGNKINYRIKNVKGKGHPCTGTEALYRPYGP